MNSAVPKPCNTRARPTISQFVVAAESSEPVPNTTIDVVSAQAEATLGTNRVPKKSTRSNDRPIEDTTNAAHAVVPPNPTTSRAVNGAVSPDPTPASSTTLWNRRRAVGRAALVTTGRRRGVPVPACSRRA